MLPRVRFAPSPSGYLHIGGARTALFNWLWARRQGGQFVLRIEDTDQERSSLDSVRAILDSMRWLGLDWDEGPEVGGPCGPYFQSERRDTYSAMAQELIAHGKAYRCYCTKEALDQARSELKARDPKAQFVYPGTCRDRKDEPDLPHVVRFKSPRSGASSFVDRVFGTITTPNTELQDFVLMRSGGFPLYNLAAVADDHAMGITLVARGRDHIGNTPQQVLLYEAMSWKAPEFAHLPMMLSPRGEKLSKRHADVGVQDYRDRGYSAAGVLNYLVRFGWSYGDREIFSLRELTELFDWSRVSRSDGKFDEKKFLDTNFEHQKTPALTSDEVYAQQVLPWLQARGLSVDDTRLRQAIPLVRERARTFDEAAQSLDFFFRSPPELEEKAVAKFLTAQTVPLLEKASRFLASAEVFTAEALEAGMRDLSTAEGLKMKELAQPLRVSVTGRTASPPLFDILALLGAQESLTRVARALEVARQA